MCVSSGGGGGWVDECVCACMLLSCVHMCATRGEREKDREKNVAEMG